MTFCAFQSMEPPCTPPPPCRSSWWQTSRIVPALGAASRRARNVPLRCSDSAAPCLPTSKQDVMEFVEASNDWRAIVHMSHGYPVSEAGVTAQKAI